MSALGLAIMIVAGAVTLDVILENTNNTNASVVGQTLSNVDLGGFFTAGVLVGIAGMIGLMLLLAGLARARRRRLERKELTRSYQGTAAHAETLQEERDRLAAELEQERARGRAEHIPATAAAPAAGAGAAATTGRTDHGRTDADHGHGDTRGMSDTRQMADSGRMSGDGQNSWTDRRDDGAQGTTGAPVYPTEPRTDATAPVGGSATTSAGTSTPQQSKPGLMQRLFGR